MASRILAASAFVEKGIWMNGVPSARMPRRVMSRCLSPALAFACAAAEGPGADS
jgi:hypothetical protein